jgi:hypothetical protein
MDSDFLVAISQDSKTDAALAAQYPNRAILHYYPGTFSLQRVPREDILSHQEAPQ